MSDTVTGGSSPDDIHRGVEAPKTHEKAHKGTPKEGDIHRGDAAPDDIHRGVDNPDDIHRG